MSSIFVRGFMLGLAYVAPIGMQNIYVINSAISNKRLKAYLVACITIFFDITLALACFYGIGIILEKIKLLNMIILGLGSLAIIYIGYQLIMSKDNPDDKEIDVNKSLPKVILSCLLVTWANPQALIDGTLLLGGFKATIDPAIAKYFIYGVCLASSIWFLSITTIVFLFKNAINGKIIRGINIICGSVLIYYGLTLGYTFIQQFN